MDHFDEILGSDAPTARRILRAMQRAGLAFQSDQNEDLLTLTETGAFWLHLVQNYFALNYVNTLWTQSRREPWPHAVAI